MIRLRLAAVTVVDPSVIVILISGSSASAFPKSVDTAPAPSNKLARASEIPSVNAAVTLLAVAMALASAAVTKSLTVVVVPIAAVPHLLLMLPLPLLRYQ